MTAAARPCVVVRALETVASMYLHVSDLVRPLAGLLAVYEGALEKLQNSDQGSYWPGHHVYTKL